MSPPGLMTTPRERRNTSAVITPDDLVRDANLLMQACGLVHSRSWISRTVRAYLQTSMRGLSFAQVLAARLELNSRQRTELLARSQEFFTLCYADPTGETASRNVDRERGSRR